MSNECDVTVKIKQEKQNNINMQPGTSDVNTEALRGGAEIGEQNCIASNKGTLLACSNSEGCLTLLDILKSFNAAISEEQAWAIIYQSVKLYRDYCQQVFVRGKNTGEGKDKYAIRVPLCPGNLRIHKDGSVHVAISSGDHTKSFATTERKILFKLGVVVYNALDFNIPSTDECILSPELEDVINYMTMEDRDDDEGIEKDSEDVADEDDVQKITDTKELDHVLQLCTPRVSPTKADDHYKAVCRALVMESMELRIFIQKVFQGEAESLRIKADAQTSRQELEKLGFSDWARFWMQVVDELRRGVRLKKANYSRTPLEFELTPYEILMEDIRTRKYNLRKVMVNGDIPPRVKKDAHAVILEFIRSRPPLRKVSDRKLAPLKRNPSPREQLLDSIRRGRILKPILKSRLLPTQLDSNTVRKTSSEEKNYSSLPPKGKQRLIKVDISLFEDDDPLYNGTVSNNQHKGGGGAGSSKHNQTNNENNQNNINTILRRTRDTVITHDEYHRFCDTTLESYDLATQCESRRASMRRHTIVGCQNTKLECHSMPPSRPDSRQSEVSSSTAPQTATATTTQPTDTWTKNSLDEKQWKDTMNVNDRLSLTLEEIVHIRSVMTKAELEGLPVGIQVKEDVERKKVCFLCLRTRFSIFGQWGVQCKLCSRTVCSKCYSKMRIPTEHFRNVPVVLLSPSLMNSPAGSQVSSPSHHASNHSAASGSGSGTACNAALDENFPRSLMERLLRPELERKSRNTVGSAPSSPKHQRSTSSTPGSNMQPEPSSLTMPNGILGAKTTMSNGGSRSSLMSRSMEGPRSLPPQSPARPHSNNSTLDRRNRFAKAFALSTSTAHPDQKEILRGELMAVCNDCRGLVLEIIRSSRQTRSSARNQAIRNLTLDLSPVYK